MLAAIANHSYLKLEKENIEMRDLQNEPFAELIINATISKSARATEGGLEWINICCQLQLDDDALGCFNTLCDTLQRYMVCNQH